MAGINNPPRYLPCALLAQRNIPYVIWFEDALRHYGVPTFTFQLYLLVPDNQMEKAVESLTDAGWVLLDITIRRIGNTERNVPQRRLMPPTATMSSLETSASGLSKHPPLPSRDPPNATETVLLQAGDWHFTISEENICKQSTNISLRFPRLPCFLDALIDTLLEAPEVQKWWDHVKVHIGYLYAYNADLEKRSFAEFLRYDNRQYHLDRLAGMSSETISFIRHEREVQDEIRDSKRKTQECSTNRGDETLFQHKRELEILKSMPPAKHLPARSERCSNCDTSECACMDVEE
jgi:hypothetical protein